MKEFIIELSCKQTPSGCILYVSRYSSSTGLPFATPRLQIARRYKSEREAQVAGELHGLKTFKVKEV